MRYYHILLLISILVLPYTPASAQEPLQRNDKRPVLIDDINRDLLISLSGDKQQCNLSDIPVSNISTEQSEQLRTLQVERQKKLNVLNFLLAEKRAQQRTLEAKDKPDMKTINKLIDEQATLMGNRLKVEAEYKQKIRSILTDEQRVEFDARVR